MAFEIRMLKMVLVLAVLVTCVPQASGASRTDGEQSQVAEGLTLDQAVRQALQSNPLIRATAAGKDAAAAGVGEAKSGRLPFLEFSETYTNSNNPVYVFGSLLEQGRFTADNLNLDYLNDPPSISNFRTAFNLRIPVFNRFQTSAGIEEANLREEQADTDIAWTEQQIRFQVISAYYGVLVAVERKKVAEDAVKTAESEVASIRDRFDQGMVVQSDLLAMEVQLAEFKQQLVQAGGEEQTARAALNTVLARPVSAYIDVIGRLEERDFDVSSQQDLIRQALQQRPDYQKIELEVDRMGQGLRKSKGQWWPDLNVFAQLGHSSQNLSNGSGDFAVGATLTFRILDFARDDKIHQAVAATQGAKAQEELKANQISFEVVEAYQAYQTSEERFRVATASVDQAAEALRIIEDRHSVGLTTITEVLRAQNAVLRARLLRLGAQYDSYIGYARLLLASGSLVSVTQFTS
jgi:outer membrane protein TolC